MHTHNTHTQCTHTIHTHNTHTQYTHTNIHNTHNAHTLLIKMMIMYTHTPFNIIITYIQYKNKVPYHHKSGAHMHFVDISYGRSAIWHFE